MPKKNFGIDTFYPPYIRLNGKWLLTSFISVIYYQRTIIGLEVIPQIITNDPDEFLFVAKYVQELDTKN
jgi:hypothetical protein